MKTQADTLPKPAKLSVLKAAKARDDIASKLVLEQMFGYFSFDPMPMEAAEERLAA